MAKLPPKRPDANFDRLGVLRGRQHGFEDGRLRRLAHTRALTCKSLVSIKLRHLNLFFYDKQHYKK